MKAREESDGKSVHFNPEDMERPRVNICVFVQFLWLVGVSVAQFFLALRHRHQVLACTAIEEASWVHTPLPNASLNLQIWLHMSQSSC